MQHPLDVGPEVTLHVVQLRLHASAVRPNCHQRQAQQPAALAVPRCSDGNMVDLVGNKWWDVARNTLIQLNGYHANGIVKFAGEMGPNIQHVSIPSTISQ